MTAKKAQNTVLIDTLNNTVIINGESNLLSKNECLLIRYFYERQGVIITKDELIQQCWPGRVVSPTSLPVAIKHIRDILKKAGGNDAIKTYKGEGYSLLPNKLEIDFIDTSTENKVDHLKVTKKKHHRLQPFPRKTLLSMTTGLSIFLCIFLGITLFSNNIKQWHTSNGALLISNSKMISQIPYNTLYQGNSIFMDNEGTILVCNKIKCYFKQ